MALFPTPTRKRTPDTSARDKALDELARAGDRLLALRRETILATQQFRDARQVALEAIATARDAHRAANPGAKFYGATTMMPGWPSTIAGEGFVARDKSGAGALHYALAEQDKAERNWRDESQRRR